MSLTTNIDDIFFKMHSLEDIIIQEVEKRPHLYKIGKMEVDSKQRLKDFEEIAKFTGMKYINGISLFFL